MGKTATSQTDFGGIYFNQPKEIVQPQTTQELASALAKYHELGEPVRIRNTGHSVNGQSLTDGVQIQIGGIDHLHFDKNKMEVIAGAGATWDQIFKEIQFPAYSIAVFPNNPGQKIKVGGTASVGGIGPFSAKYGGLWNQILELKLVTMTGEIITCSRTENPEIFKYALGGFGRIGVISELTLRCIPSKKEVIWLGLIYHNFNKLFEHLDKALMDPTYEGAFILEQLNHVGLMSKFGIDPF